MYNRTVLVRGQLEGDDLRRSLELAFAGIPGGRVRAWREIDNRLANKSQRDSSIAGSMALELQWAAPLAVGAVAFPLPIDVEVAELICRGWLEEIIRMDPACLLDPYDGDGHSSERGFELRGGQMAAEPNAVEVRPLWCHYPK